MLIILLFLILLKYGILFKFLIFFNIVFVMICWYFKFFGVWFNKGKF